MMTNEVARIARAAGATCYTDPFIPNAKPPESAKLIERLFGARDARKESPLLGAA
jgi:3-phenylpropionate/trans-cinnamate dioxygenase ferredoxin reductase subunit